METAQIEPMAFDKAKQMLDRVFPTFSFISEPSRTNAIVQISVLIYGKQGSGKTELIKKLVEYLVEKYGEENVNAVWTRGDLYTLLERGIQDKLVNVLACEDLTLQPIKRKTLADFFNIRHVVCDRTKS